ncbi:hypothetical protein VNO77_43614 [Canavalia gladiata]|uniref:Uncharacterized protein n=1 Tax=Canavalia gladiata TaxID=3824 RepID=A0AAN9PPK8_CANGL
MVSGVCTSCTLSWASFLALRIPLLWLVLLLIFSTLVSLRSSPFGPLTHPNSREPTFEIPFCYERSEGNRIGIVPIPLRWWI